MKSCTLKLETPRGTFNIHTIYASEDEARADGWGFWFQHGNYLILGRDNRTGAVVEVIR
jgi:hypothetical protein